MMKSRNQVFAFIAVGLMAVGCTACGTIEASRERGNVMENADSIVSGSKIKSLASVNIPVSKEISQSLDTAELSNTYTTKLTKVNNVAVPVFMFNYPQGWTILNEGLGSESENVELINDRGVLISYQYLASSFSYGNPRYEIGVEISKVADSSFVPGYAQTTDYSNLGKFVVSKVKMVDSENIETDVEAVGADSERYYYAVKPEYECGVQSIEGNFVTGFWYDGALEFMAEIPGTLTSREEEEVIAILSSFRVSEAKNSSTDGTDPIYTALQNGDFSELAGTYRPLKEYEDLYGGGEPMSDLVLDKNGIVTGGGAWFYPNPYPNHKPISVTKNEDGSYQCQVKYEGEENQDYFLIYPKGTVRENPYIHSEAFLTESLYIQYMSLDGGVSDIIYYKVED